MINERSNDRLFGLVLGVVFASVIILNAMSY
jgi:tetrahydromethanopterin S-methyltransferase subunit F